MLLTNEVPYVIGVFNDVGYALCEIAENPRHTSRTRSSSGVSQLARNVPRRRRSELVQARCARRRHQPRCEIEALCAMHGAQLRQKLIDVVLVEHGQQRHLIHVVSSRHAS